MLQQYSTQQLLSEIERRTQTTKPEAKQPFRTLRSVLIVAGVHQRPTRQQINEIKGYSSRRSSRKVLDIIYDHLHKSLRIITENSSHGQNVQDDIAWLMGKTTRNPEMVYWTDSEGRDRVRGLLHKVGIKFAKIVVN